MIRERFWRTPAPAAAIPTMAHLAGATEADFTRTETHELFLAIGEAVRNGARGKAAILAALPEHLREHAEWISSEAHGPVAEPKMAANQAAEAVAALRLLNVRRELVRLQRALVDDPTNKDHARRVGVLTAWMAEAARQYPRADLASRGALSRERDPLPNRAPLTEGAA